ncbi:MAG: hypothetical protein H7123_00160, partial [Thermoleophilia bacterium]|nr:hypothetical protein [Thermoleophilia bacterium]
TPLQSTLVPEQLGGDTSPFARYVHAPQQTTELMQAAGWQRKPAGSGSWHKGSKRASIALRTTAGNPLRLKAIQLMQQQLNAAGFATTISVTKPEVFFGTFIAPGRFDLAMFAFGSGPDPTQTKLFACSEVPTPPDFRGKNDAHYCSQKTDDVTMAADAELDPSKRAVLLHQLEDLLAADLPVLPLFQPPDTLAYDQRVGGVHPNPLGPHTWDTENWWVVNP